jgi:gliding motility-associated-like protein
MISLSKVGMGQSINLMAGSTSTVCSGISVFTEVVAPTIGYKYFNVEVTTDHVSWTPLSGGSFYTFVSPNMVVGSNYVYQNLEYSPNTTVQTVFYYRVIFSNVTTASGSNYVSRGNALYGNSSFVTYSAELPITVNPLPVINVSPSLVYGSSITAIANTSLTPFNWTSSDATVATVTSSGVVSGLSVGTFDLSYENSNQCLNTVSITVNAATLTVTAASKTKIYGEANPSLTFGYTGLVNGDTRANVEPSISTSANTSSGVGTYSITLSGGSDPNYNLSLVSNTLTVNAATLTVTAASKTKIYGEANPSLTFGYSGLVNGDTRASVEPTVGTTATNSSPVGTYSITLSGGSDPNYNLSLVTNTLTVNAATLTITADAKTKKYGETNPALTFGYTGLVNGDTRASVEPTLGTTATNSSSVGTYSITLSGGSDPNYNLSLVSNTLNVNAATLTITADAKTKKYGETNPALTFGYTGLVNGDTRASVEPSITTNATTSSGVGTYSITLSGGSDPNYNIIKIENNLEVTPKALGIKNISVNNKVYDGTTSATISGTAAYDGLVAIDNNIISVVGTPTFSFDTKDVGEAKAVSVSGYEKPNNNYTISQPTTLTANITAKVLSITSASVKDKVYDGLTDAIITGTLTGIVGNEDVSYNGDGDFENKNVGTDKTITTDLSLKGADKANYLLPQITGLTANITAKVLTITSAKAENKVYDGLTDAVITGTLTGMIGTEVVDFDGKGSFADKNVGTEKEVTTAVSLTGTDKSNYSLDQINGLKANITSRSLIYSVTANSKIYDGNRNAEVEFINNKKSGDILTVIKTDAIFENKNVGIGKTVSITGIALTGTDAGNYTLTSTTATAKADITAKSLTISATATNKVYDGTVSATVSFSDDRIDNDILTVTKTAANFANKNVGSDKEVTVTGIALTGTDAGNYSLTTQTLSPRANIEARVLSVTGSIPDRFYDGTDKTIGLNLSINKIAGDDISISKTGDAFDNPNVGDNKDIIVRGLSIIPGGDAANYYLASTTAIIKGNIKPLKVNINANDAIKTETDPDPVFTFTNSPSLIAPDTFTGALSRNFLGVNNPGDYPINIGTLSAGSNYLLSLNTAKLTIKPLVTNYIFEVPNAFTPNLDGTNDLLYIIKNYRVTDLAYFRIFNRTGQMVFESRNFADGWNGKKMGDPSGNVLESDMYIWIAEFTRMNDTGGGTSIERKTGSVLLLK